MTSITDIPYEEIEIFLSKNYFDIPLYENDAYDIALDRNYKLHVFDNEIKTYDLNF